MQGRRDRLDACACLSGEGGVGFRRSLRGGRSGGVGHGVLFAGTNGGGDRLEAE
jgi:hypothetical protein